ncbi:phage major capsid E family protein [Mycobacteroides abscessus subsp. bolletii 1513]|uniref:Phage major capsid E family protein n=1 Tax=Mycobacteroides abscessus subsp. bolletii 1513 TaxID=1299321 RepID=X8DJF4_9MYCO|nr:phage major capsid E family protein [Mycobacteroides abscessus subsp. bolletii 1513]
MTLWTDVITPAALTGYAREALADRERRKGSLAAFLPNRTVPDIVARFVKGDNGLLDAAEYRSYDAEVSIGETPGAERVTIELPPLGRKVRVSEYDQLRLRGNVDSDTVLSTVLKEAKRLAYAISDKLEVMRGKVIDSGKAAINENGFIATADFGRGAAFAVTAATLWSDPASKPLTDLRLWRDAYVEENGDEPGVILTSRRVLNALMLSAEMKALATNSATAPGLVTEDFVQATLSAYGLPRSRCSTAAPGWRARLSASCRRTSCTCCPRRSMRMQRTAPTSVRPSGAPPWRPPSRITRLPRLTAPASRWALSRPATRSVCGFTAPPSACRCWPTPTCPWPQRCCSAFDPIRFGRCHLPARWGAPVRRRSRPTG